MRVMKNFRKSPRLQADSLREIKWPLDRSALRLQARLDRADLKTGLLLNALAAWFAHLPEDEQDRVAVAALRRLAYVLADTDEERAAVAVAVGDASPPRDAEVGREITEPGSGRRDRGETRAG